MSTKNMVSGSFGSLAELSKTGLTINVLPERPDFNAILVCEPKFFEVKDVKNVHMEGKVNTVDVAKAQEQWLSIKQIYEKLGYSVKLVQPAPGLEDMVFSANQTLPGIDPMGKPYVVCSEMVHESRQKEVPHFAEWFKQNGYSIIKLPAEAGHQPPKFEGQGDALWHPDKRLLWGGYGFRTQEKAYDSISKLLNIPIIKLYLGLPGFYHLDVAFCPIDISTVLIYPPAFTPEGLELIKWGFPNVIEVCEADANNFACNAVPLGKKVLLQRGSTQTCQALSALGYEPYEVDTDEFMKSGGSVACMWLRIY